MSKTEFDLSSAEPRDRYKLLTGLIVPRPIGWVGTTRQDGTFNLAPFSFFNCVSANPPTVVFSGGHHADRPKDSVVLAEESGEFTINIVSQEVSEAMSITSATVDHEVDEFELAGVTPVIGTKVAAPMVVEAPANLECRVNQVVYLGDQGQQRMVIGEVVALHVDDRVLDGTRIISSELKAIGRMAGDTYITTDATFDLNRPR